MWIMNVNTEIMNSKNSTPENLVDMNEAHRQLMTDQIEKMESRVQQLEQSLLHHATRMYDVVTQKLDSLFSTESIAQFDSHPEGTGTVKVTEPEGKMQTTGISQDVTDSIELTRQQLEMLNQTIENIQQSR